MEHVRGMTMRSCLVDLIYSGLKIYRESVMISIRHVMTTECLIKWQRPRRTVNSMVLLAENWKVILEELGYKVIKFMKYAKFQSHMHIIFKL